jgi:D-galacturonate reductase
MVLEVTMVGGGMIAQTQLLPSLYHLRREGLVGAIRVVARHSKMLRELAETPALLEHFPGQTFEAHPPLAEDPQRPHPDMYRRVIENMPAGQLVVVATPETTHYEIVRFALEHGQHVLAVKPLVMTYAHAVELRDLARSRGLFVGVEYHKRFDRRALEAKGRFAAGQFGNFRLGEAKLLEPWHYRESNFQNWFTRENTDPFTYVGCHYVDLVCFITGLRPAEVSVRGVEGTFPNGNVGYLWSAARVAFDNGGVLSVINALGYPDDAAGSNDQGMVLWFEAAAGGGGGAMIVHADQYRGVQYSYARGSAGKLFNFVNPDFFRLVPWAGDGLRPVGYGYDSIEANVRAAARVAAEPDLPRRQAALAEIDAKNLIATPANTATNELVTEAGRLSITNGGRNVRITYGASPGVELAS